MADARRYRIEARRVLRAIHRTRHGRDATQMAVALAAAAFVLVVLSVVASGIGAWAWVAAALPAAIEASKWWRRAWRRRHDQRRQVSMADLQRADLSRRSLANSYLRHCDLTSVKLVMTNLSHADLTGATLDDARLRKANLTHADLTEARCRDASFFRARLVAANLDGLDGRDASFHEADLRHASLVGADLGGADLTGADVRGANFADATMAANALTVATTDAATVLPDGRSAAGAGRPTLVGWRASVVRATRLGAWELARPVAVGLAAVTTIAGVVAASELSSGMSFEMSMLEGAGADGTVAPPRTDLFERTEGFDGSERTERSVPSSGSDITPNSGSPGAEPTDGGPTDAGLAGPGGAALDPMPDVDGPGASTTGQTDDDIGGLTPLDGALTEVPIPGAAASQALPPAIEEPPADADGLDGGTDESDPAAGPVPDDEPAEAPTEADPPGQSQPSGRPPPGQAGQIVPSGMLMTIGSAGGASTVSFRSPLGDGSLVVTDEQQLDFDGLPIGVTSIEVVPDDAATVATCAIAIDGTQRSLRQGFPGESITCEVDLDR